MLEIKKILNNNAVIANNEKKEEVVVTGRGLAFQKQVGDRLDESKMERVFTLADREISNKLKSLLSEIPIEYVNVSESIIHMAREELAISLNDSIYLTLTDHIHFAVERMKKDIFIDNPMVWEVQRFYKDEYAVGLKALKLIEEELGVIFPNEEAASIAMHIVNAELDEKMPNVMSMIQIIQDILSIIRYHFGIEFDEESIAYQRLVTHLKFFTSRIIAGQQQEDVPDKLFKMMKEQFEETYQCALKIKAYSKNVHDFQVCEKEMSYLMVHMERIVSIIKGEL